MEAGLATRLHLLCHAATRSMREGGFPSPGEPIDEAGVVHVARYRAHASIAERFVTGPALAARQTADGLGTASIVEEVLRDIDHGSWAGRSFADVHAHDPAGLMAWIAAPAVGTPDGEPMATVLERVATWMQEQLGRDAAVTAVTHPMVIRAAIAHALDIPVEATFRIDIAPLSTVQLSFNGQWRLQALRTA